MEKLLGHPVHWEICLLHGNELPFQALFIHYDGKTSGPTAFKGPIGKALQDDLTQKRPVQFEKIENKDFPMLPDNVIFSRGLATLELAVSVGRSVCHITSHF